MPICYIDCCPDVAVDWDLVCAPFHSQCILRQSTLAAEVVKTALFHVPVNLFNLHPCGKEKNGAAHKNTISFNLTYRYVS